MTDRELLKRYASGSQEAFSEIVRRHAGMVHANCLRILGDAHAADDAAQAAFLVLVRKARRLPAKTVLSDWLFLTSRFTALDLRRKLARQRDRDREAAMTAERTKSKGADWTEVRPVLDIALASLPRTQRRALVLCYLEGKSQADAASELGCPESTVATWVARGLEGLRGKLRRLGVGVGAAALPALLLENAAPAIPAGLTASIEAVCLGSAAASPAVLAVAEGAAGAMLWAKTKTLGIAVLAAALASGGGTLAVRAVAFGVPAGRDLPANRWVKAPDSAEFRELRRHRAMISGTPKSRRGNWIFQSGMFAFSATGQGVWLPAEGRALFVNGHDGTTWKYDPATGGDWNRQLKGRERPKGWKKLVPGGEDLRASLRWASMCLDPVNNEVVFFGGNSADPGGSPGTMLYSLEKNEWRRLDFSKSPLARPHAECEKLRLAARRLEGRLRGRWHLAETDAEARENLGKIARELTAAIEKFAAGLPVEGEGARQYVERTRGELNAAARALMFSGGKADSGGIAEVSESAEHLRAARDALAVEPAPRANSPLVFDPASGKVVLFGGDHLDYLMSDTWTYDPQTRCWSQRQPEFAPTPRGGHALVHLPRSGKVALLGGYAYASAGGYGGYAYARRPLELWTYDVAADRWESLGKWAPPARGGKRKSVPAAAPVSPVCSPLEVVVSPDDVIVVGDWALRADPHSGAKSASESGGPAGTVARRTGSYAPGWWDALPAPDAAANEKFLASIPANTWVAVKPPKTLNVNRDKSTATFDTDRGQIFFFGGGRSAYSGTDVHMYSVRANRWRTGFGADMPVNFCGSTGHHGQRWSFAGRPFITSHSFKLYAYDPRSRKMLLSNRGDTFVFDPAVGDWEAPPVRPAFGGGVWVPKFCTAPSGVVVWAPKRAKGAGSALWRFDPAKRAWSELKTSGGKVPGTPGGDYGTLVYDSKRNRVLMFASARKVGLRGAWSCELSSGTVKRLPVANLSAGPIQPRECAYVPGGDLVLFAAPRRGAELVYDIARGRCRLVKIAGPAGRAGGYALTYDPKRDLVWSVGCGLRWPLRVMRFEAKTAKFSETK